MVIVIADVPVIVVVGVQAGCRNHRCGVGSVLANGGRHPHFAGDNVQMYEGGLTSAGSEEWTYMMQDWTYMMLTVKMNLMKSFDIAMASISPRPISSTTASSC